MNGESKNLLVVSNRLPFVFDREADGGWRATGGAGGLVSALVPVLRNRGGTWIGWPGTADAGEGLEAAVTGAGERSGFALKSVMLSEDEVHGFYQGFANEVIWPLFHDLQMLGVDRLDYTKGIPERLYAFANALDRYPELRERVSLIQVVVPSRIDIPEYHELKVRIEQLVGEINGRFVRPGGWVPIWYVYRSLTRTDLLAYYRAADIAFITPLKDGMNLVAKEYCACSIEEDCVLILSEFAGAAAQLERWALLVNPYDIESVADTIRRAHTPARSAPGACAACAVPCENTISFAGSIHFCRRRLHVISAHFPPPMTTFRRPCPTMFRSEVCLRARTAQGGHHA